MSAQGVLAVMGRLVDRYIANRGTDSQFICCVTPNVHGDDDALRKSDVGTDWLELDEARATVAELIEAGSLVRIYDTGKGPCAAAIRFRAALARATGEGK